MECPICLSKLTCEYEYRGEGYVEESCYRCPNQHYVQTFVYGFTEIVVYDKIFTFSYLTKPKALRKIAQNVERYARWKERNDFEALYQKIIREISSVSGIPRRFLG